MIQLSSFLHKNHIRRNSKQIMQISVKSSGFTIVELLIVIVIIAILAAFVIVAYSGIQQRANNTQTVTAVREYIKAISAYAAEEGHYPTWVTDDAGSNAAACLGEGYPLIGSSKQCGLQDAGATSNNGFERAALNTKLRKYINKDSLPLPSMQVVKGGAQDFIGAMYVPGMAGTPQIWWWVSGASSSCGDPGLPVTIISNLSDGRRCRVVLSAV